MGIQSAMDRVTGASTIVEALRAADDLAFEAGREPGVRTLRVLSAALAGTDDIAAIAAVHALAEMFDEQAAARLVSLLDDPRPFIHEHAAWALGQGLPRFAAIARLIALVRRGGFTGMLAQHTLEKWSVAAGDVLAVALESVLTVPTDATDAAGRARVVETLGLVRQSSATGTLLRIARDEAEPLAVREAGIAALGQRPGRAGVRPALEDIVAGCGPLADHARLAVIDLEPALAPTSPESPHGLTIAQLFLHADIDPSLSAAGAGDNGGIATLLVRLGDALTHEHGAVDRVLTLSRGSIAQATADLLDVASLASGHLYGHVPLAECPMPSAAAWPLRVRARRGIRRLLRAAGHIDVLHLRMADVGSLAAADVARELGIPTVFTLAPDPHGVIQSMDRAGTLTRENFGETDLVEHFWFRTSLVRSLAGSASHSVLFPRPNLAEDMRSLVGIDIDSVAERHTIVAEGVDLEVVDRSVALVSGGATDADPALVELAELVGELAPGRRDLPLIVTVGRMHRVKGMATLAETWAGSTLSERANLLIIGGDLENPSLDEREQLDRIEIAVPVAERAARGLILAGHRPNDVAARWVAATRLGIPGAVAGRGVYVCASIKEEFGIALLEALATGLVVVAPDGGGPATYVADQDTGFLTATWDTHALEEATHRALDRAALADPAIAERARAMVAERFTIQAMAAALAPVYQRVAEQEAELVRAAGTA